MTNIWIRSAASPNAFLRMDGSKVTGFNGTGSGTVNCQFYGPGGEPQNQQGNDEVFSLVPLAGGDGTFFAIRSMVSENVYLRMDGSEVGEFSASGSGTVNCQYYADGTQPEVAQGNDEVFQLVPIPDSPAFAIRSMSSPKAYLRVAGAGVTSYRGNGSGIVNCQYYAPGILPSWTPGNSEAFYVAAISN